MQLGRLDHVNVRTSNVAGLTRWYCDMLGMTVGPRPPFPFPGAWLYAGDQPCVHLVGVSTPPAVDGVRIEHFAFAATGLEAFTRRLADAGQRFQISVVPGFGIVQVNVWDPDGNHIHIDFPPAEGVAARGREAFRDTVLF